MRKRMTLFTLLLLGIISALAFQGVSARPSFISVDTRISNVLPLTTPTPDIESTQLAPSGPPLSLTISMLCFCFMLLLIVGVFILGVVVRRQNYNSAVDEKL